MNKARAIQQWIEREAFWQGGTGTEWECDAIVSASLLDDLLALASNATTKQIIEVVEKYG